MKNATNQETVAPPSISHDDDYIVCAPAQYKNT